MDWDQKAPSKSLRKRRESNAWMKTEKLKPILVANICSHAGSDNGVRIITFMLQGVIWAGDGKETFFSSHPWHCTAVGNWVHCQEWDSIIMDYLCNGSAHRLQSSLQASQKTQVPPCNSLTWRSLCKGGTSAAECHVGAWQTHELGCPSALLGLDSHLWGCSRSARVPAGKLSGTFALNRVMLSLRQHRQSKGYKGFFLSSLTLRER